MNKKILIALLYIPIISSACSKNVTEPEDKDSTGSEGWQLVWSDEFDSTSLDLNSWTRETGGNGWGNNELEYYTDREENSYLEDGNLVIKAMQESYGGRSYTSARLKTQGKRSWKYGKIEARIKLPYGQGIWPAFWTLGQNISSVGWPKCGEIDIMEMIGGQNRENTVHGTAHWDNNGQHAQYGGSHSLPSGTYADDFHIFTIDWDQNTIKWYVDNLLYNTISITPSGLSEFHQDFFIILNLAVGGNWPGNPNSTTIFPQYLEIDYVRVYQLATTDVENDGSIPLEFNMEQNYPNPFNGMTIIKFFLPQQDDVIFTVHDNLGSEVYDENLGSINSGSHEVRWEGISNKGTHLSSGVYFYSVKGKENSNVKKLILLN